MDQAMKKLRKTTSALGRCFALAVSSLFLLLLSFSQPHRVHHFFESYGYSHDGTQGHSHHHDQRQNKPFRTDCVVQSMAQNCHLGQNALFALPFVEAHLKPLEPRKDPTIDLFPSFSVLQRAPPKDTQAS
jgi:hypothetical protein